MESLISASIFLFSWISTDTPGEVDDSASIRLYSPQGRLLAFRKANLLKPELRCAKVPGIGPYLVQAIHSEGKVSLSEGGANSKAFPSHCFLLSTLPQPHRQPSLGSARFGWSGYTVT